jgi:hypothetical protein
LLVEQVVDQEFPQQVVKAVAVVQAVIVQVQVI